MADNSFPRMLHKGHDRKIVGSQEEMDAALEDGFGKHHGETEKRTEAAVQEKEQLGEVPAMNDHARQQALVDDEEKVLEDAGVTKRDVKRAVDVTGTVAELKERVAETGDVETLRQMRTAEEDREGGGRAGALKAIDARIEELGGR